MNEPRLHNQEFHSLLRLLISHWQRSAEAYAEYMQSGKKFRYAELLKYHNTAAKNLLVNNNHLIPEQFKNDAEAIVEHYTIWSSKWDALKTQINPTPEDEFVFENVHRFPKAAAQNLETAFHNLS